MFIITSAVGNVEEDDSGGCIRHRCSKTIAAATLPVFPAALFVAVQIVRRNEANSSTTGSAHECI